jgi:hypothetical protein
MDPELVSVLGAGMERMLCTSTVDVYRYISTADGAGGTTLSWAKIATIRGRMINTGDSESVRSNSFTMGGSWTLVASRNADVMSQDRIRIPGDSSTYWDVIGTDFGKTALLVQHITLIQSTEGNDF